MPYQEKKEWINGLARIYKKQGVEGSSTLQNKIAEVTGLSKRTIRDYLSSEFKQIEQARTQQPPRIPASTRIEHELGKEYVERHREEVLKEETPKIEKKLPIQTSPLSL